MRRVPQLSLFTTGFDNLAIDDRTIAAITAGAPVAFSLSGGKDSVSISHAANRLLDQLGHPHDRRVAIHADLGRIEWPSTPATVEATADALGIPLLVRNKSYDMLSKWERRFELGRQRYVNLETYHLTGPWSSANNRFCTSEMKTQVMLPALLRHWRQTEIVSVVGIRREESAKRRLAPISKREGPSYTRKGGGCITTWHPGVNITEGEVYAYISAHGLPLHESYRVHGSTRMGCAFCVLASEQDITAAARAPGNRGVLFHLVEREASSTFSFQPQRWLGDVAPDLLPASLAADLWRGKVLGADRQRLEAAMPQNLRYVKGWPQRIPSIDEAQQIAQVRRSILAVHNLDTPYDTAHLVRDRIAELYHSQRLQEAA